MDQKRTLSSTGPAGYAPWFPPGCTAGDKTALLFVASGGAHCSHAPAFVIGPSSARHCAVVWHRDMSNDCFLVIKGALLYFAPCAQDKTVDASRHWPRSDCLCLSCNRIRQDRYAGIPLVCRLVINSAYGCRRSCLCRLCPRYLG